jgi:hypothetical protein
MERWKMRWAGTSRRDPMKVAQYEVLGWRSERVTRPGRDDRLAARAREAVCERRGAKRFDRPWRWRDHRMFQLPYEYGYRVVFVGPMLVDRPFRDAPRFSLDSRHFVPGYFRNVPTGHTPKSEKPHRDDRRTPSIWLVAVFGPVSFCCTWRFLTTPHRSDLRVRRKCRCYSCPQT